MSKETLHNITLSSGKFDKEKEYWLEKLSGVMNFNLPLEYQRVKNQVRKYETLEYSFSSDTLAKLAKLARNSDHAVYIILLVAVKYLLYLYTSNEDVVVISPIPKQKNEKEYINNILAIRTFMNEEMTFKEMLLKVKQNIVEANENLNYPLQKIAEELGLSFSDERLPFSDVVISMENIHDTSYLVNKQHDASFFFVKSSQQLGCHIQYDAKLFRKESIQQKVSQLETLLKVCLANPDQKMKDVDIISVEEKHKLLVEFNQTEVEYPSLKSVHQLFEEQVQRFPDQIALVYQDQQITYQELNTKSNQLARALVKKGVQSDQIVGIMVERSFEMFIGLLGILKASGAYLPIDPDYPKERVELMVKDSKIQILLTQQVLQDEVQFAGEVICLDDPNLYQGDHSNLGCNRSTDLAYVIYTSGSTGRPKGVMVEHHNVVNFITGITSRVDFTLNRTILALTTISFDIFVLETWVPLSKGSKIVIADEDQQNNMAELKEVLIKNQINLLQITPSRLKILMDTDHNLESLKAIEVLMVGGEPFSLQVLKYLQTSTTFQGKILNMYGPTETTVWSTMQDLTDSAEINIGKPIANTQIYIINQYTGLNPIGVAGELCIGGTGVTRGYLNNPELTEERFILNPFGRIDGRVYRTGDVAKWLPDGNIEFLGRNDHQVKIRGYRIELGEIENQLLSHERIIEAIVIDKTDLNGDKYLCAYLVVDIDQIEGEDGLSVPELRGYLAQVLPEYMIPSYFIHLDEIPLTPNGKINRKALPEPDGNLVIETEYVAPRNETEEKLTGIWADLLGVNQVGINDNFFALGGQSFKAMLISSRILTEFDVKIAVREMFEKPTVKELALHVNQASKESYHLIEKISPREYYPVSAAQKRLYVLNQFGTDSISYNIPNVIALDQDVDQKRIESTLRKLIKRHEALRTSFKMVDNQVVQVVHEEVELQITYLQASEENLKDVIKENICPFDLNKAPLLHAVFIASETKNIFILDVHHIIFDGFSIEILTREFMYLYEGIELPELKIQYKDFAAWQNEFLQSEQMNQQEEYWLDKFTGEIPVLNLPTDYQRPGILDFEGDQYIFKIDQTLLSQVNEFSFKKGVTLYMTLVAAYYLLLAKYSNQEDIIIGTPHAGRHHSGLENVIGMFVNTLALRGAPSAEKSFTQFLNEIKEETLRVYENQDYQFDMLVQKLELGRDTSRNPLFDVLFILQNMSSDPGDRDRSVNLDLNISKFDLTLTGVEQKEGMKFALEYRTNLFKRQTIEHLAEHYIHILKQIIQHPDILISQMDLLSLQEREQVLYEFNATKVAYGIETIHQLFEKQVAKSPNLIALVFGDQQLSYTELNQKANQLARRLRQKGVKPGQIVGLMVERSLDMMISIMAILKAGGAYLPIDPVYPEERIKYMLDHSEVNILVTQQKLQDKVEFTGESIYLDQKSSYDDDLTNLPALSEVNDLAYVIYTSGSTGKPKGVMIENKAVHNFIKGVTESIDFGSTKSILCVTTISFDIFVLETLLPLAKGLKVIIASEEEQMNPQKLAEVIQKNRVDMVQSTPSRIQLLASYDPELTGLQGVQEIMVGGEDFPEELLKKLKRKTGAKIYNMYGPTETTVWSTIQNLTELDEINIGRPIANTEIYILDPNRNLVPPHVKGELYIGGDGMARGYLNRPELTEDRFVSNPFKPGEKMYRTGDLAMWLYDGNIKFLGRVDHQVKIRGYRIELGEIENQLLKYEPISEAAVIDRKDASGNKVLCAYFSARRELSVNELRVHLSQSLTDYMIPAYFVQLDGLPKTPNGKVDRNTLPEPDTNIVTGNEYVKYRNGTEERLVEIWSELFEVEKDQISVKDKFFEIGGDSLKIINLMNKINEEFDANLQVTDLFKYTTIEMLAEVVGYAEVSATEEEELKFTY